MFKKGFSNLPTVKKTSTDSPMILDFWLNYDEVAPVIFLDQVEFAPVELVHPMFFNRRQHLVACMKELPDGCPLCQYVDSFPRGTKELPYARPMGFLTILDLREYTKDDGEVVPVTKKLLKASKKTIELIQREMEMSGVDELAGTLWKIGRGKEAMPKPPAVGDMFRYDRKPDLEKLLESSGMGEELLQPFTPEQLAEVVIYDAEKALALLEEFKASKGGGRSQAPQAPQGGQSAAPGATGFKAAKLTF